MLDTSANENLGAKVRELRISKHLTQQQVADALGVTPGYISNVENNRVAMSLRVLTYYARLVGTTLDSLVGEMEPAYAQTALDNDVIGAVLKLDNDQKRKLLATLRIWA